jgi:hypothetical protein
MDQPSGPIVLDRSGRLSAGLPARATCDDPGMDRRQAVLVYYGFAVALGLLVGVTRQPGIPFLILLIAGGVAAAFVRSLWLGARAWSKVDLSRGLVFASTLLTVAWDARNSPFA